MVSLGFVMPLFGTSGIRDLAPSIVSPSLALRVGELMGQSGRAVVVGYDGRRTGLMLKSALVAGAAGMGSNVLDIGLCATPTLAWFAQQQGPTEEAGFASGAIGAMITASHNPPQYNGIKLFLQGREMPKEEEERIEKALMARERMGVNRTGGRGANERLASISWDGVGAVQEASAAAKEAHLKLLLSCIDTKLISSRKPRVVVDCANAAGCALMPRALREAGCQVDVMNGTPGEPYGRELEPTEKSLSALSERVLDLGADLGIAHDGDADRAIVVDERGQMLGLDVQLALVVKEQLKERGKGLVDGGRDDPARSGVPIIVSTVESSLALRELVEKAKAKLDITPVGSLHVAARMRQLGAPFGGEPCGEYLFENGVGVPDGLMAGLYFVQLWCKNGGLSHQANAIARYPVGREKIGCANAKKAKAMAVIAKNWPFEKPSTLDGLRSDMKEGWVLVRPSGTEPYIRITSEARSDKKLQEHLSLIRPIVKKACA
jgi:phosphoglucosamine mutase